MIKVDRTIHINASPDEVWAVVADVDRLPQWTPTLRRIERDTSQSVGPGIEARLWLRGVVGASRWRVTDYDADRRAFTWESDAPGLHSIGDHRVEPDGDGSRVTLSITQTGAWAVLARPFIGGISRLNVQLEAKALKRQCERSIAATDLGRD